LKSRSNLFLVTYRRQRSDQEIPRKYFATDLNESWGSERPSVLEHRL
jgi:hypothetical protein